MYPVETRQKCKALRRKGLSLNELGNKMDLPKTTIYYWIREIKLSQKAQDRIRRRIIEGGRRGNLSEKKKLANIKMRKKIKKPGKWSLELINIIAHFMFDGEIYPYGCCYVSKDKRQIDNMKDLVSRLFDIIPRATKRSNGTVRISFYSAELGEYVDEKARNMISYITKAKNNEKRIFLKSFFDDEGCIYFNKSVRKVRGYQHSVEILKLIQNLLKEVNIYSRIENKNTEIVITGRRNIERFQKEINFSPGIYINPKRKNGLWKYKIEKRKILEKAISSYKE